MSTTRALVIGGTGPTGPYVVNGLVARGHDVTILHTGNHEVDTIPADLEHIHTDPFDRDAVTDALAGREFDLVVAMYGRLRMLAGVLAGRCARFVSVGGVPVYRGFARPDTLFPVGMATPTREDGIKIEGDEVGKVIKILESEAVVFEHHPTATHLRYPLIYGPGQLLPREWLIVRRILDGRRTIVLPDAGLSLRTAAYGENAAHALLCCVDHPEASAGKVYNVGDDHTLTLRQTVEVIADALDHEWEIVEMPLALAPHTRAMLATSWTTHRITGTDAIRADVGYRDAVPVFEAVARTARWLVANPPTAGGREERGLQDPFDYDFEDRLVTAWRAAVGPVAAVADSAGHRYVDRYAEGRRNEQNARR
jgi:nucleoside-diphosphate-sugar epimerase